MSTATSVSTSVIARTQATAGNRGHKHDEAGGQAFAAIMRGTKSTPGAAVAGSHVQSRPQPNTSDPASGLARSHPDSIDTVTHRTDGHASPRADTPNDFGPLAAEAQAGTDGQSGLSDAGDPAEPKGSETRQGIDRTITGQIGKSEGMTPDVPLVSTTAPGPAEGAGNIAPVETVGSGPEIKVVPDTDAKLPQPDAPEPNPKPRITVDLPTVHAAPVPADAGAARQAVETRKTAALHDAKAQAARAEHRREPEQEQPVEEAAAPTRAPGAEPRATTHRADSRHHAGNLADTKKARDDTDAAAAAPDITVQDKRDPIARALRSESEEKPLNGQAASAGREAPQGDPRSSGTQDPAPRDSGAGRESTQAREPLANAQPSPSAASPAVAASAGTAIAAQHDSVAAPAKATPAYRQPVVLVPGAKASGTQVEMTVAPAQGSAAVVAAPVVPTPAHLPPVVQVMEIDAPQTPQVELPKAPPQTSAPLASAIATTAVAQPAATAPEFPPVTLKVTPATTPLLFRTVDASAPQTFRAELTMAAANYAIFAGKSQVDDATPTGPTEPVADAEEAEIPSQPIRIAVLPPRAPQSTPGLVINPLPVAGTLPAPSAQAQIEASAAALEAELDNASPGDGADVTAQNRAEPVGGPISVRGAAMDGAVVQTAPPPGGSVASTVLAAVASEPTWRPANVAALSQSPASALAAEPKTLSIQLHPAELGVVTAILKLAGDQLTVELSADSPEARSRLSADSHAIAKSLRALGFDVDQISVVQPMITSTPAIRTDDAAAVAGQQLRDQQSSGAGTSGGSGGRLGGQQAERNGNEDGSASRSPGTAAADRGSGGLYI